MSRNPQHFWTSGQWMTEKNGGSDVGKKAEICTQFNDIIATSTETVALFDNEQQCHRLYGYKWFTSATDANMSLTLARSFDEYGKLIKVIITIILNIEFNHIQSI